VLAEKDTALHITNVSAWQSYKARNIVADAVKVLG
jgi:hypothetical protein